MSENNNPENRNSLEKILCLAAYIFSLPAVILVMIIGKKSALCLHHARRSLELFLFLCFLFISWYLGAHILFLIPYAGFPIAMAIFGIVVAAFVFCLVLCIMGIIKALQGKTIIFPFVTSIMVRIDPLFKFLGLHEV